MVIRRRGNFFRKLWGSGLSWLRRRWIWIIGSMFTLWFLILSLVAWDIASKPVEGAEGLIAQMGMLIAISQALLGLVVAVSTIYYAKRTGEMVDLMNRRELFERSEKREGAVLALTGSAMEVAGYAGGLAQMQRFGLRWYRRLVRESPAQRDFLVASWKQLSNSVARVTVAVERLRVVAPDLSDPAEELLDSVMETLRLATIGEVGKLQSQAAVIRDKADLLEAPILSDAAQAHIPERRNLGQM